MAEILIVDDEESIGDALKQVFEYEGHRVRVARNGPDALALVEESPPDVTFLDVKMPGLDGLEVLDRMRSEEPQALVIMISGHGTIDTAVDATEIPATMAWAYSDPSGTSRGAIQHPIPRSSSPATIAAAVAASCEA